MGNRRTNSARRHRRGRALRARGGSRREALDVMRRGGGPVVVAGVNEKRGGATDRADGRGRLRLLATNASIYRDVVPRIVAAAPDPVLVVVTDPPDPLADLTRAVAGHDRVLSTGTTIDTLRFRVHVAAELGVHPSAVEGLVVGEHGTTR
jgi:L-lactate dehydrogenase